MSCDLSVDMSFNIFEIDLMTWSLVFVFEKKEERAARRVSNVHKEVGYESGEEIYSSSLTMLEMRKSRGFVGRESDGWFGLWQ